MSVIATDPRQAVQPPDKQDWVLVLLAAMGALAGGSPDSCHGWDAGRCPAQFAQAVLHDLDPIFPLPVRVAT